MIHFDYKILTRAHGGFTMAKWCLFSDESITGEERFHEWRTRWKSLSVEEQAAYSKRADELSTKVTSSPEFLIQTVEKVVSFYVLVTGIGHLLSY